MLNTEQAQQLLSGGGNVLDKHGDKVGSVGQVFLDDESGQPEWITVKTGFFGSGESFVPLRQAEVEGNDVRVPFDKDTVKDAPRISDEDGHLSEEEEETLYDYYGYMSASNAERHDASGDEDGTEGRDSSDPTGDSAMTRSEEQLHVGTETTQAGRARLRKYVVTENVTQTVPVSREEVRLEREPITDANRDEATSGPEISSDEHEVTLNEERVVVQKETVPVERVRVDKETVTDEQQVSEEVRKEQIELEEGEAVGTDRSGAGTSRG
jgi:uncharacterized protein (TIGR02271 family)